MNRPAASLGWLAMALVGCQGTTEPLGIGDERVYHSHREVDLRWQSSDGTHLVGTLLLPLGDGPFPAVIAHFGSGKWSRPDVGPFVQRAWIERGWGLLMYDKRGVGESGGACCNLNGSGSIEAMSADVAAGVRLLRQVPYVDPSRVGMYGYSQGGWVLPLAAVIVGDAAFTVVGSGAAVSIGEEQLFSELTGDDDCRPTGLSAAEIARRMAEAEPSGFDPRDALRMMSNPGFWFFGGRDTSNPVDATIAVLETMRDRHGRDYSWVVFETANHEMIPNGGMCQSNGPRLTYWDVIFDWINNQFGW